MMGSYRRKIRNCIRKDTYRYYIDDSLAFEIWDNIQKAFGTAKEINGFNLLVIENDNLIIRKDKNENTFTLIKKKGFFDADEENLHQIIGMN